MLTGGAVRRALTKCTEPQVFVLNGDTYLDVEFSAMETVLAAKPEAKCVIAAKHMLEFERYGTLDICSDGTIRSFLEKAPCSEGLINGGTYLIRRDALLDEPDVFSLENDWFSRVVKNGVLSAVIAEGGFIDIGIPEDYELAQELFAVEGGYSCGNASVHLAMFDRDGTINVDTGHLHSISDCEFIDSTIEVMKRYSADPLWRIVVVTNQAGIAKGMYSVEDMRCLHREMADMLYKLGVEVDGWYFCPHHPSFTGECECRKPKPGMLLRVMRDYRVNPTECVMFGDMPTDRDAAKAAGIPFFFAGAEV